MKIVAHSLQPVTNAWLLNGSDSFIMKVDFDEGENRRIQSREETLAIRLGSKKFS